MKSATFWNVTVPRIMTFYSIAIFAILWIGFFVALIVDKAWLDILWNWLRDLPLWQEIIAWVLFLPISVGLWIWESSWPMILRWLATAGLVGWTLLPISNLIKGKP
ncbi:MAG: hypothetical protein IH585_08190 [Anaerolineaceae bacterium]|nr:hypothetical protein [Anaerolineaceae bacterium]